MPGKQRGISGKIRQGTLARLTKGFTSEESLTVTMKKGEKFVVKVTDAQISTHVITADGKNYIITVTYGPEAGIPDGADLNVTEIDPDSDAYESYLAQAEKALGCSTDPGDIISDYISYGSAFARFFDISIVFGGKEIEPKATVSVEIAYAGSTDIPQGIIDVVHFADSGVEVIDARRKTEDDSVIVSFEQGSFSVTGTIINYTDLTDDDYYILYNNRRGNWYAPTGGDIYRGNVVTGASENITIVDDPNSRDPQVVNILNNTTQSYTYYVMGRPRTVTANRTYRLGWTSIGVEYGQGGLIFKPDEQMFVYSQYDYYMGTQTPAGVNLARVSEDSGTIHGNYPNMTYNEEQLDQWLNKAMNEDPIQNLSKKASVYDYDNRIYEIDFTARSGVLAMSQDLSMAFVTDVSNSMLFPASLDLAETSSGTTLNNVKLNYTNLNKLPHSDGEVYFTIGDKNVTSTVYALWYGPGKDGQNANRWHAMDASYFARWKAEQTEGVDFTNRDLVLSNNADNIALHKNDSNNNSANSTNPKSDLRSAFFT